MSKFKNELLNGYTERIKRYQIENCKNYVYIGMNLSEIQSMNMLQDTQYKNIKEYALDQFGYESTKTYDLINVYNKFFKAEQPGSMNKKYFDFTFSQLTLMLSMNEEQISLCQSNMTFREIKDLKYKKSVRTDSQTIDNTELLKNNNIINGIFSDKEEEKTTTLIVTELPQEQPKENKSVTIEVKTDHLENEQNNYFVPIESKEQFYKNSYLKSLEENDRLQNLVKSDNKEKSILREKILTYEELINYINLKLCDLKTSGNLEIIKLYDEVLQFKLNKRLPDKVNFFKNVI